MKFPNHAIFLGFFLDRKNAILASCAAYGFYYAVCIPSVHFQYMDQITAVCLFNMTCIKNIYVQRNKKPIAAKN